MAFVSSSLKPYDRSLYSTVSLSALNYQVTDRIKYLARPKIRRETTIRHGKRNDHFQLQMLFSL